MSEAKVPYADTLRIMVPGSRREEVTRGFVAERISRGILKMSDVEVLALQHFKAQGCFDVTFRSQSLYVVGAQRYFEVQKAGAEELRGLRVKVSPMEFTVVVHVFNPFVDEKNVTQFLRRWCATVSGGEKVMEDGLWTGRRRYRVQFRRDERGFSCFPPRSFTLGPYKGRLFIPAFPETGACWTCGKMGHESRECTVLKCIQCHALGHVAKDCVKPKSCSLCGETEHLYFDCPLRARSYARAAAKQSGTVGTAGSSGISPAAPPKEGREREEKRAVERVVGAEDGGEGSVLSAGARPHGGKDGRKVCEGENKGAGEMVKKAEPGRPKQWSDEVEAGGDFPSSQEQEMVDASEVVRLKRPLVGEDPGGTPGRRPRTVPAVPTSNKFLPLQEEEEADGEGDEDIGLELREADPEEVKAVVSDLIDLAKS